jgi:hypothetical protein
MENDELIKAIVSLRNSVDELVQAMKELNHLMRLSQPKPFLGPP